MRIPAADLNDTAQILGIVELRRGVEIEAAALAAERRTQTDLIDMRAALDAMAEAIATGDVALGAEADLGFHRAIARATRNENYIMFFDFMAVLLRKNVELSRRRSSKVSGRGAQAQKEHAKVFAAIEKGDPDMARQFARIHVVNTEARLRSLVPERTGR
ncbi:FadR/GntR family transcriptional regulator [Pigmentiphaga litoralis]|uniref:FadR/GntR family transcriptional regulator n=1 Tax=Pigmentiphaga litoralis TaxID=516702 RepID=UPI003B429C15